ncbi:hypothetical protein [Micromonospora polyrhachis]|uniref:Uncharacterized protein n=1 Tax=Micromonospora polyrhachis TaxID=1282883 RepID=A0A7W7WMX7_9ACTN|nr:hypothetical protein [Micromonospora polyrhachis]MBB4957047.1 hypothetical protein [Micromonospora polyrhachis]
MDALQTVATTPDDVDALIAELEAQFGDVQMLPQAAYPCVSCTQGCTHVASCAC